jgi:hypothetical protein
MGQSAFRLLALAVLTFVGGRVVSLRAQGVGVETVAAAAGHGAAGAFVLSALPNALQAAGQTEVEPQNVLPTFVDLTPDELGKRVHELKHLKPAKDQALLPMILKRVGNAVVEFFGGFPSTTCSEHVSTLIDMGRDPLPLGSRFNYVALVRPGQKDGPLEEFRTDSKGQPARLRGLILTSGFVSLITHFRPVYQADSRFRYLGREMVNKENTYVLAFAQRPGARQAEEVRSGGRTGFVLLQGVAWIAPRSFQIVRLRTEIEQPDPSLGLSTETTQVDYAPVSFKRDRKVLWLPREVTVSGKLRQFAFTNQHRYSQYRLFVVEAGEKRKGAEQ